MLTDAFTQAGPYLDSATYGLLPIRALAEFTAAARALASGTYQPRDCDRAVDLARSAFARMHGVAAADVAVGHQVSEMIAPVAASLRPKAQVLAAEGEFTSLTFPFAAAGCSVTTVPLERLADAVSPDVDLVAVSAVQSADGRLADLQAIAAAADAANAWTLVDTTQASGWLPLNASRFDFLVAGGYKWLCQPRGTAYLSVRRSVRERIRPLNAGWYAGADPWQTCYGMPLRLAPDARRFDVSPAWLSWHPAAASMELLERTGIERINAHNVSLANRLRDGLGMAPTASAIVSYEADPNAATRLANANVRASVRAGRVRLSCHLYTTEADVDQALSALHPARRHRHRAYHAAEV